MANVLYMKGKQPHKMYIKSNGELRQVKYAYYNGQQVYSCYEPPVITGVRLNISKTTLTNTNDNGDTTDTYIEGHLINNIYVFTIPACQCTINDIAIKWTQEGPDGECGTGDNYYTLTNAATVNKFKDDGTPSYYNDWNFNDYSKSYDNLNDTDNSNDLDLGISGSFQIIINGELSNICNFKYIRQNNTIIKDAQYNNIIPTLEVNKTSSYNKETLTFSGLTATLRYDYPIYTSSYQKESEVAENIGANLYVQYNSENWTLLENNSSYEVTTESNKENDNVYKFKAVYEGLDTSFESNICTFTQPKTQ